MKKRGFAIVEVLVAFIILTSALSLLTYSQKNFNTNLKKLQYYENIYTTVHSLKNKIDIEFTLGDKKLYEGKLNNINYSIKLVKIKEGNNLAFDSMEEKYIPGFHTFTLYKVTIHLPDINRHYEFYKLKTFFDPSILDDNKREF